MSERRQRLDARGAARGQVGRERGDGAQQHDDDHVRLDVVRRDAEEQRAERAEEQQRAGDRGVNHVCIYVDDLARARRACERSNSPSTASIPT